MEPLNFSIPQPSHPLHADSLTIKVHQAEALKDSDMHDTGLVMWPSAVMLSRWIANHPDVVLDCGDVLELGAGCGLVGLVAAALLRQHTQDGLLSAGAKGTTGNEKSSSPSRTSTSSVIITDYNAHARNNIERNVRLNDLESRSSVLGLDFFDQQQQQVGSGDLEEAANTSTSCWTDMDGKLHPQVHLILAADIICYSNDADLVAQTIQTALIQGGRAIVMGPDENRRFGLGSFVEACEKVGLEVTVTTLPANEATHVDCQTTPDLNQDQADVLASDLHQTSGFVNQGYDYNFHMYTIEKPMTLSTVAH